MGYNHARAASHPAAVETSGLRREQGGIDERGKGSFLSIATRLARLSAQVDCALNLVSDERLKLSTKPWIATIWRTEAFRS